MLARSATIFKWTLYTLAGLVWVVVQAAFLQRVTIWGVIPFLYPLIAALPATFEGPCRHGADEGLFQPVGHGAAAYQLQRCLRWVQRL